jgi:hypothetical protein
MDADERDRQVNELAFYGGVVTVALLALMPVTIYLGVLARLFRRISGR